MSISTCQEHQKRFGLPKALTCAEKMQIASSGFVFDETPPCPESRHRLKSTIPESNREVNVLGEDEEIFELLVIFSKHEAFETPEPEPKRSLQEQSTDLPPPTVFRRKGKLEFCETH
jgi:hypothetical protein